MKMNWNDKDWRKLSAVEQARQLNIMPCDSWKISNAANWYDTFAAHKAFNLVSQDIRDRAATQMVVDGDCDSLSYYIGLCNTQAFDVALGLADECDDYIVRDDNVLIISGSDGSSLGEMLPVLPLDGRITFQQAKAIYATACTIQCEKCGKAIVLDRLPYDNGRVCSDCADWEGDYE